MRRTWPVVATSALLVACGGDPVACTQIGCTSGVSVTIEGFGASATDGVDVRACLDAACRTRAVTEEPAVVFLETDTSASSTDVTVSVKVSRQGTTLLEDTAKVALHEITPNGEQCPPTCDVSFVAADPHGLRQV